MDDLLKKLMGIGDNVKNFVVNAIQNVEKAGGNAINQGAHNVQQYFDPNAGAGTNNPNFWKNNPVSQGLANVQQFAAAPPRVDVKQYLAKNPADQFVGNVINSVVNTPQDILAAGNRIGTHIREGKFNTPQTIIGDVASAASPVLNIATMGSAAPLKSAAQIGAKTLLKEAALQGAKYGLGFGTLSGLDANAGAKSFHDQVLQTIPYSVGGLVTGAALSTLFAGAGVAAKQVTNGMREVFTKELPAQIASDLRTGITFQSIPGAQSFQKAFALDHLTDKEIIDAVAKFQSGEIGDTIANDTIKRTAEAFLPKELHNLPTTDLAHVWDYILARKNGSWVDKVPAPLEQLDKSIFQTSGSRLLQAGKIDFNAEIKNPLKKEAAILPEAGAQAAAEIKQIAPKLSAKEQQLIKEFPEVLQPDDIALLRNRGANQEEIDALQSKIQATYAKQKAIAPVEPAAPVIEQPQAAPSAQLTPNGGVIEKPPPVVPQPEIPAEVPQLDTATYIKDQVAKQREAAGTEPNILQKAAGLKDEIKKKIVDFTAPIEDRLAAATKAGKYDILPQHDVRYQIDKALRSDTLASQFIKDNGFDKVIQGADNLPELNQFLIAKRAIEVAGKTGKETGRDLTKDQQLVQSLGAKYEPLMQNVREYNQKLLDYKAQAGLIPKDLAEALKKEYPDYVPFKRVFSAIEEEAMHGGSGKGGVASISTQNVLKRLKGSEREIVNPLESIVENTAVAFREGERNKTAQMLINYKDLPNNPFELRALKPGEATTGKNTVSAFIDGKKVTYETLPDVAQAAKNLNSQQLNILGKILSVPTRALQMGAVGYNIPFVLSNLVRDQGTSSVISQKAMKTSIANPLNFVKAFYNAVGHGALYDDWVRSGSSFTQFDIARDQVAPTVEKIFAGRSKSSNIAYKVTHPAELFRAVENIIGRTEELTRIQQFAGTRDALIKEGRTAADAEILGGAASRTNTANFGRKGEWGAVLNGAIPFFNAGIQGARSLVGALTKNPKGTAVRFATTVGLPVATATVWNMANEQRRIAYADIPEYEKENNLIILPPVPTKDENGNWNAIKIPVTPGLSNLMSLVRRQVEGTASISPEGIGKIATDIFTAGTSIDPSNLLSSVTPQGIKPLLEDTTNTNLFTKQKIVPEYMKSLPADQQVKSDTSQFAKTIGGVLGVSPLRVENFVSTAFAGVGRQLIGKSTVAGEFNRRFFSARGGEGVNKIYDQIGNTASVGGDSTSSPSGKSNAAIDKDLANYGKVLKFDKYLGENPYTGIKASEWDDEKIGIARKAYGGTDNYDKMPDEVKNKLYEKLGMKPADVEYDYSASQKDNVKSKYLIKEFSKSDLDHQEIIAAITTGRRESVGGSMLASNGVLDDLYEAGLISSAERTALKKVKLTSAGEAKIGSAGAGGSGGGGKAALNKMLSELKSLNATIGKGLMSPPKLQSLISNSKAAVTAAPAAAKLPSSTVDVNVARKVGVTPISVNDVIANSKLKNSLAPRVSISGKVSAAGRGGGTATAKLSQSFYHPKKA